MSACHTDGPELADFRAQVARVAGDSASKLIHAVVAFEIYEIKPLADFGQGWEKSIGL
jgi:hypothetical protein